MRKKFAIGADIGGSHICSCVVEVSAGSIVEGSHSTIAIDSRGTAESIVTGWAESIRRSIEGAGVNVSGVGLAFPGPFDYERGISLMKGIEKFDNIFGLNISEALDAYFPGSGFVYRYVNDASAFALGEYLGGCARNLDKVVCLTLGSGVGSAFIESGMIVESGPCVPENGWVYNLPFEDTIVDDSFSTRWFLRRYEQLTGAKAENVKQIAGLAGTEEAVDTIFEEYGRRLAQFAVPVCQRFGCRHLVLGGNISRSYPLFGKSLEAGLNSAGGNIEVCISTLRDDAAMVGAASLFLE